MNEQGLHNEIMRAIGRLEGKVEEGFKSTQQRLDAINGRVNEHDRKINKVQNEVTDIKSKAAVIGGVIGTFFALAVDFIKEKIMGN